MTRNPNSSIYKSALEGLPFEARQMGPAIEIHVGAGRQMGAHKFYLCPVLRSQPDIDRLGRAILELAMQDGASAQRKYCQS